MAVGGGEIALVSYGFDFEVIGRKSFTEDDMDL